MKYFAFTLSILLFTACKKTSETTPEDVTAPLFEMVIDIANLEDETIAGKTPIKTFAAFAEANADDSILITKINIESSLIKAAEFSHAIMVVGNHTVIKITDLKDCKQSASWGACMPKAEGYIKNGKLQHQKDYANNIIGLPDNQKRTLYLFN